MRGLVWQRISRNLATSPYLHGASTGCIAFSLLILGAFAILYTNIHAVIHAWQGDVRIVAYVKDDLTTDDLAGLEKRLADLAGVEHVGFVSKEKALERFKEQLGNRASLLEGLRTNPLPASFEILLSSQWATWQQVEVLAKQLAGFPQVADVEYARAWLHRLSGLLGFFRLASLVLGALIVAATVFLCANTIRLTLYAKRQELEVMRLVGATDRFISFPYYVQNVMEGLVAGVFALGLLYGAHALFVNRLETFGPLLSAFQVHFLPPSLSVSLVLGGMGIGWFASLVSLRTFLKA